MKSRTKPALWIVYGLCVRACKEVLAAMIEADPVALFGPKRVPDTQRRVAGGGNARSAVVPNGQRIGIRRPRARAVDAGELELSTGVFVGGRWPSHWTTR
jgi:hypothetical protein